MIEEKIKESGTLLYVPFKFDKLEHKISLIDSLNNLSNANQDKKITLYSSTHYPDFLEYHLTTGDKSENAYLNFYRILDKNSKNSMLNHIMTSNEERIYFKITTIDLVINNSVHNDKILIGYWIITIEWQVTDTKELLSLLSTTDFFRFHDFQNKKDKAAIFFGEENEKLNLIDWIERIAPKDKFKEFNYYQNKYTVFHLLNSHGLDDYDEPKGSEVNMQAYKSLRVPPKAWSETRLLKSLSEDSSTPRLSTLSMGSRMMVLDEGAIIIEYISGLNDIKNKYAPAFLLALNQREIIHFLILKIAKESFKDKKNEQEIKDFEELKWLLKQTKHNQLFHTISKNSEINMFFHELQNKFMIDIGIKDIEESIEDIYASIDEKYRKKQDESQDKMNNILIAIALLSVFSVFNDGYDLFDIKGQLNPNYVWVCLLIIIGFLFYTRFKPNSK